MSLDASSSLESESRSEKYKDLRALLQLLMHLTSKDLVSCSCWKQMLKWLHLSVGQLERDTTCCPSVVTCLVVAAYHGHCVQILGDEYVIF